MSVFYLSLFGGGGLASFDALGNRLGREAALAVLNDHLVTVDGPLGGVADVLARVNVLLELGEKRSDVADTEDALGSLLEADLLDAAELREFVSGDLALAASGSLDFPGGIHQVAGQFAFTGTSQIGHLVASLGAAETAQTAAVDGRAQNNDFLTVAEDADHVADWRIDFEEVIDRLLDDGDDDVLRVLQSVGGAGDGNIHTVNLNLLLGGEEFDLLIVEQNGDDLFIKMIKIKGIRIEHLFESLTILYLLVVLFAGEDGHLVAVGAVLGEDLVAAREGGVVEEAIESGDGLRTDQADT